VYSRLRVANELRRHAAEVVEPTKNKPPSIGIVFINANPFVNAAGDIRTINREAPMKNSIGDTRDLTYRWSPLQECN